MKPKIRLKISDVQIVPQEILSRNQENLEKLKRQKREWIKNFGQLPNFDLTKGKLSKRLTHQIADIKESNLIVIRHQYLQLSRTMSQ